MGNRLRDKVAIVAGAGQTPGASVGNGRACALRFASEGASVVCVDRDQGSVQETVDTIRSAGGEAISIVADVTSETECEAFVTQCLDTYGRVDVLHNNVGIGAGDTGPSKMTEEVWDRIMGTNLKGVVFAVKHVLPAMRQQQSGSIISISSVAAVCATGLTAYKTSKAALNAYTHTVAMSNARFGIRANVIMPGLMNTPMAIEVYTEAGHDRELLIESRNESVPLQGGMGSSADIANAALFLASDEASFITGAVLPVDGGQSARIG